MADYWRAQCSPIIAEVIAQFGTDDMEALHEALEDACPYGKGDHHAYKIWLKEIKRQLSPTVLVPTNSCRPLSASECDPNQRTLFD